MTTTTKPPMHLTDSEFDMVQRMRGLAEDIHEKKYYDTFTIGMADSAYLLTLAHKVLRDRLEVLRHMTEEDD